MSRGGFCPHCFLLRVIPENNIALAPAAYPNEYIDGSYEQISPTSFGSMTGSEHMWPHRTGRVASPLPMSIESGRPEHLLRNTVGTRSSTQSTFPSSAGSSLYPSSDFSVGTNSLALSGVVGLPAVTSDQDMYARDWMVSQNRGSYTGEHWMPSWTDKVRPLAPPAGWDPYAHEAAQQPLGGFQSTYAYICTDSNLLRNGQDQSQQYSSQATPAEYRPPPYSASGAGSSTNRPLWVKEPFSNP